MKNIRIFQSLLNAKTCSRSLWKILEMPWKGDNSTWTKFEYTVDAGEDGEDWCLLNLVSKNSSFSLSLHFTI